jgi:hypothetical protein
MALARCESCGAPDGRTKTYSGKKYLPVGHPQSGLVCGAKNCRNAALIWLTLEEERDYQKGERIFGMDTATSKVHVQ